MIPILENIQFINPTREQVNLNQKERLETEYNIHYTVNFVQNTGLKEK